MDSQSELGYSRVWSLTENVQITLHSKSIYSDFRKEKNPILCKRSLNAGEKGKEPEGVNSH